jgi:hypothetical protein
LVSQSNFDNDISTLSAIFPSGEVCEFAGTGQSRRTFTYQLRARSRDGVLDMRVGSCLTSLGGIPLTTIPVLSPSSAIRIEFDADGSGTAALPVLLATINIKPK